jgi:hypothetical protein
LLEAAVGVGWPVERLWPKGGGDIKSTKDLQEDICL